MRDLKSVEEAILLLETPEPYRQHALLRRLRLKAAKMRGTHTKKEWEDLVLEFNGLCVRCGRNGGGIQKDHIIPIYQGGSDSIGNLQPLCRSCNLSKGPETINWVEIKRSKSKPSREKKTK